MDTHCLLLALTWVGTLEGSVRHVDHAHSKEHTNDGIHTPIGGSQRQAAKCAITDEVYMTRPCGTGLTGGIRTYFTFSHNIVTTQVGNNRGQSALEGGLLEEDLRTYILQLKPLQ